MSASLSIPASAWVIYTLFVGLSLYVYARAGLHVASRGGKVRTGDLGLPELLMSFVLAGTFIMLMVGSIQRQSKGEPPVKIESVLPSALVFVIIAAGVLGFLSYARRLRVGHVFGMDQVKPLAVVGWASGLFLAALPITACVGWLTKLALKDDFASQPLVQLFSDVARQNDHFAVAKIFVVGAILAPCCEEFLFRGFFYGVWKRYLGPLGAGFLASVLFAALHTSLSSLPSLFVLAVCLNLAYERTGSLLVPIGLHAMFNSFSLLVLYLTTRFPSIVVPS